ncbi:MAG: hypothetical protein ACE5HN_10490 [Nitrospiria bacterium]
MNPMFQSGRSYSHFYKKEGNKRKKVLIKPSYQLKVALTVIVSIMAYSLLLGFIVFFPLYIEMADSENIDQMERISTLVLQLHKSIWPAVIVVAIGVGIQSIYATHRIVGPSLKIKKNISAFIKGNFVHTKLRKTDNLRDIELVLNELADKLTKLKISDEEFHGHIKAELKSISKALEKEDENKVVQTRQMVHKLIEQLETYRDAFTIRTSGTIEIENKAGSPIK